MISGAGSTKLAPVMLDMDLSNTSVGIDVGELRCPKSRRYGNM